MPNQPLITGVATVTAKDINGNSVAKHFYNVLQLNFNYNEGMVNVIDVTGSFYFPLTPMTSVTYTIVANPGGSHTIVMS